MSKHTPGPWPLQTVKTSVGICHKIGPFLRRNPTPDRKTTYACVYEDGASTWAEFERGTLDSELLANARLIAAAPDLLAAAKAAKEFIELIGNPAPPPPWMQLRDAIATAEGRE